jgi:hypothetical protein
MEKIKQKDDELPANSNSNSNANSNSNSNCSSNQGRKGLAKSQHTRQSEVQAIDLILKVINLTQRLHANNLVHSNLCPAEIVIQNNNLDSMLFSNLFFASWNAKEIFGHPLPQINETITKFDVRNRKIDYISPEQAHIGRQLEEISKHHNGRIDDTLTEVKELIQNSDT